jgi:hypothetical protein
MHLPFELEPNSSILVVGAGGGYDVVCALPVSLSLRALGHQVHLGSYSFTTLEDVKGAAEPWPHLFAITSECQGPENQYFPEGYLAQWWARQFSQEITIWSYHKVGVQPLTSIFAHLCETLSLDAIVVVDAGVDGLFEGTEFDIATPAIDAISIVSAYRLSHLKRYFAFTAFGTEGRNHSVRHADALMRIAQQVALGGMLDVSALLPQNEVGKLFMDAVDFIHNKAGNDWHSNMASSVVAALKGKFGHHDLTNKTTEAPIWVSPLTLLYWFFQLETVAEAKPFNQKAIKGETVQDMIDLFEETREKFAVLPRLDIPI